MFICIHILTKIHLFDKLISIVRVFSWCFISNRCFGLYHQQNTISNCMNSGSCLESKEMFSSVILWRNVAVLLSRRETHFSFLLDGSMLWDVYKRQLYSCSINSFSRSTIWWLYFFAIYRFRPLWVLLSGLGAKRLIAVVPRGIDNYICPNQFPVLYYYSHDVMVLKLGWVAVKKSRSRIQTSEMRFLRSVTGCT